jgi:hypothetical protein
MVRFNRDDVGISNLTRVDPSADKVKTNDAIRYINMTEYFRGNEKAENLIPPYTTRVLIPFVASFLPFEADTSINVINLICMVLSLFVLYKMLLILNLPDKFVKIGCLLYVFSFTTFYYGTVTYVDAALIFFLFLGSYFIVSENYFGLLIALTLGTMTKETAILLIPVFVIYSFGKKSFTLKSICLILVYVIVVLFLRYIKANDLTYFWLPSIETTFSNLGRPRTYLSFLLTFGIPGALSVLLLFYFGGKSLKIAKVNPTLLSGIAFSVFLWIYSVMTAYSDGRFIWPSIVFSIPFSMLMLNEFLNLRINGSKAESGTSH